MSQVLEALTTERCNEKFSLERLEVLGDAFLKFAVGRHLFLLHGALDEGQLTRKRSNIVNNSSLLFLATRNNLQAYIRDQSFEPNQLFAIGRNCPVTCNTEMESIIHSLDSNSIKVVNTEVRCSKHHHWLQKKTIADVLEALVGAFLVDTGMKGAAAFLKWVGIRIDFEETQLSGFYNESTNFLDLEGQIDINALENQLDYQFIHKGLLIQAFVHPSYGNHLGGCYQRLEFLGDAVLDYLITSYLYTVYPKLKPGQLTDMRSAYVNNTSFAHISVHCSFHKFIISDSDALTKSMNKYAAFIETSSSGKSGVEEPACPKAMGDLVESCIGAILLDTGFDLNCVWKIMLSLLKPVMSFSKLQRNPVRDLQELCQSNNFLLEFSSSKKNGMYSVSVRANFRDGFIDKFVVNGSKKVAKKLASEKVIEDLKAQGYRCKSKSLEEVLKGSVKMEAQLIGYDGPPYTPITIAANGNDLKEVHITAKKEPKLKVVPTNEKLDDKCNITWKPMRPLLSSSEFRPIGSNPKGSGGLHKGSARSILYEACATNYWKPPTLECCLETGPDHLKLYTFKAMVEINDATHTILECYGKPLSKKKDAAEHAAKGAIFYLNEIGYMGNVSLDRLD